MEAARQPKEPARLGAKVRALRRRERMSQTQLADHLGISPSYLNLIENNRRPLPSPLLIKLAQLFKVELDTFASDEEARASSDLLEVFADPVFEHHDVTNVDVRELVAASPAMARAVVSLYRAYRSTKESADTLASRVFEGEQLTAVDRTRVPSEEVSDLIQRQMNHFPELEAGAEELWRFAKLDANDVYGGLMRHLQQVHRVEVRMSEWRDAPETLRRYDPERRLLMLSELLPTRSRSFQMAHQIALLERQRELDRIAADPRLTADESRALARVAMASYFAAAVLMPYAPFLAAAKSERYDIDVLSRRFRVGFEQASHRLTTLRRPGAEGVPFHMIRTDMAGNISKRFSGSGIRFARFSGACPRWNIFGSFATPGMIRIQLSRMPDGITYFCIARSLHKEAGSWSGQQFGFQAIGIGCQVQHARELVYADGIDLDNPNIVVPVGVTCRLCERTDCAQRVLPPLARPLQVDPNVRGVTLYTVSPAK